MPVLSHLNQIIDCHSQASSYCKALYDAQPDQRDFYPYRFFSFRFLALDSFQGVL